MMNFNNLEQWIDTPPGLFLLMVAWTLAWKGVALWHSAMRKEKIWFVVLLLVNTLGLLEIFYTLFWVKRKSSPEYTNQT